MNINMNDPTPKVVCYKKHFLEDFDNELKVITVNINCAEEDDDGEFLLLNTVEDKNSRFHHKKKKVGSGINIFENSDIICHILSFVPFVNRWKFKSLSRAFYNAFNTKYAWTTLDFQFIDVDLFNMRFLNMYQRFFDHTYALSIAVNDQNNIDKMVQTLTNLFKNLTDLRLYYRKRNSNVIYEYVHPVVMHFMRNAIKKDMYKKKKKSREQIKRFLENQFMRGVVGERNGQVQLLERNQQTNLSVNCETNQNGEEAIKDSTQNVESSGHSRIGSEDSLDMTNENSTRECTSSSNERTRNPEIKDSLNCDISDLEAYEIKTFFLENAFYKYFEEKNKNENKEIKSTLLQKYVNFMESQQLLKTKQVPMDNPYANLERIIIDVELKGSDLLFFIGKLNNLKDILISKLIYGDIYNRAQNITVFTSFIEHIKSNSIRLILFDMYYRYDYKPVDYMKYESFREILKKKKEHIFDINKEEGDELIYILQKNHLNSLNCLWSNDLCISYNMYKKLKNFKNLQMWILPGWRALSLAKQ